ncbi:MAG TPA: type II secretion system protein, partial [Planctomycetaceae bacterium]|nr:type II secretion system protein [Planctomycetaceae bacterium]
MNRRDWQTAFRLLRPICERATPSAPGRLRGFSLIEILVVLGIIAFLTAAIVVVMPRLGNASKIAATQATIKKVDELLNDRINGFNRWINTQNTLAGNNAPSYVVAAGNGTLWSQNPQLYQFLSAKIAFRASFAQNFSELTTAPSYNTSLHKPVTESAACLYMILTTAAAFDTEPPAAGDLKGVEVADTDGDGLMEIVDAWGQPLRFYRWPTRLFRPAPSSTVTQAQNGFHYCNNFLPIPAPTPSSILVPDEPRGPLTQWTANTAYSSGQIIQPATIVQGTPNSNNVFMYTCTTAGTSGGTEPTWGTTAGATTNDGPVAWQAALDPLAIDSDDPNGLAAPSQINESSPSNFHTWGTYHVPLIVSCGTDGLLGLYEPFDTTNFGTLAQPQFASTGGFDLNDMYDNITNH